MNKEEFYKEVKEKISLTENEYNKMYDEIVQDLKEREVPEKEIEKYAITLVRSKLKKQLSSPAKKFIGFRIGINPNTPLNRIVDKVRDDGILAWRKDETEAVENKFTDVNGKPMWHIMEGVNTAEWKLGKLINDNDYTETVIMMAKQKDDKNYKLTYLTLRGDKRSLIPEKFMEVEFMANLKSDEGGIYKLNQSINTEFKVIGDKEIDFPAFAKKHLKTHCSDINDLEMWHDKYGENRDRLVITKSSVVNIIPSLDEDKSHILHLDNGTLDNKNITCWLDQKQEFTFNDQTPEIFIIGSTNQKTNEDTNEISMSINVYDYFVPKMWRIVKPKEIKDEKAEETKLKKEEETKPKKDEEPEPTKEEVDKQIEEEEGGEATTDDW